MKLASIERIVDTQPIPGADRIEAARVLGFWTIVKKGEFKPGDFCVWHNPDTVVNIANPTYAFLKGNARLRTIRMRGQVSQGLALPVSSFIGDPALHPIAEDEGTDVSELLGIKKYEKPESGFGMNLRGDSKPSNWPSFLQKTDEINIQTTPALLGEFIASGATCILTKKYDGCSATYYDTPTGQGVCSRNQELEEGSSVWWNVQKKFDLLAKIKGTGYAVQGEIVGPGIQGNPLGLTGLDFFAFDIFDIANGRYLSYREIVKFFAEHCIEGAAQVGLVRPDALGSTVDEVLEYLLAQADRTEYALGKPCEGLVLRSLDEVSSRYGSRGRLSAKIMSRIYVEE